MSVVERTNWEERYLIEEAAKRFGGHPVSMIEAIEFHVLKEEIWLEWKEKDATRTD